MPIPLCCLLTSHKNTDLFPISIPLFLYMLDHIHTAIATQAKLTYGLNLSPILAHFQNMPSMPSLFLSITPGRTEWM
jgi:hypothetical protein